MSTWAGWQSDILKAAGVPDNQPARNFLSDWHSHEGPDCPNNPLLASRKSTNSTVCRTLAGGNKAQSYPSPKSSAKATAAQLKSGTYTHLLAAFTGETWWEPGAGPGVYADLVAWGVPKFADWYKAQFGANFGSGGPPSGTLNAPAALSGWKAVRRSINRGMPQALSDSQRARRAALRSLSHVRKVRV